MLGIITGYEVLYFIINTSQHMKLSDIVNPKRLYQLFSGVLGIYITFLLSNLIQEDIPSEKYLNNLTGAEENFTWPAGFLIFPCSITWLIGGTVNYIRIKKEDRTVIPAGKAIICAVTVAISTLSYIHAIILTSFPVVMMVRSCNVLSVILVGVLCSRVKDKKLKLGTKKIVVGVLVTAGIFIFWYFDPEFAKKDEKETELLGIILLFVSLLADGFLPDFQADIKITYKPQPMEMMTAINKWVAIVAFLYSCVLLQIWDMLYFFANHHLLIVHILTMGLLSTIGQMFVYRMIKQFKQHFPPFVLTTRKIFTVGLSIFYYHHQTNFYQFAGIVIIFVVATYEFVSELIQERQNENSETSVRIESNPNETLEKSSVDLQMRASPREDQIKNEAKPQQIHENEKKIYDIRISHSEEEQGTSEAEIKSDGQL